MGCIPAELTQFIFFYAYQVQNLMDFSAHTNTYVWLATGVFLKISKIECKKIPCLPGGGHQLYWLIDWFQGAARLKFCQHIAQNLPAHLCTKSDDPGLLSAQVMNDQKILYRGGGRVGPFSAFLPTYNKEILQLESNLELFGQFFWTNCQKIRGGDKVTRPPRMVQQSEHSVWRLVLQFLHLNLHGE